MLLLIRCCISFDPTVLFVIDCILFWNVNTKAIMLYETVVKMKHPIKKYLYAGRVVRNACVAIVMLITIELHSLYIAKGSTLVLNSKPKSIVT